MSRLVTLAMIASLTCGCERVIWPDRDDYQQSKTWSGLWVLGPGEHDERFCPDSMPQCVPRKKGGYVLEWPPGSLAAKSVHTSGARQYWVQFVGRRSTHMHEMDAGKSPYVIKVEGNIYVREANPKSEQEVREFRAGNPGVAESCVDKFRKAGLLPDQTDECFQMDKPRRWHGLWETGWEWSNFCPDPAKECDWMAKSGIWLTFAKNSYPGRELEDGTFRIKFIGRRSKVPGYFGHLGSYEHLMVVDRVISIEKIPGQKYTKR